MIEALTRAAGISARDAARRPHGARAARALSSKARAASCSTTPPHRVCRRLAPHAAGRLPNSAAIGYETVPFEAADRDGTSDLSHERDARDRHGDRRLSRARSGGRGRRERIVARLGRGRRARRPLVRATARVRRQLARARGNEGPVVRCRRPRCASLDTPRRAALERRQRPSERPVDTIERLGGGSVRCMLAEIGLPAA